MRRALIERPACIALALICVHCGGDETSISVSFRASGMNPADGQARSESTISGHMNPRQKSPTSVPTALAFDYEGVGVNMGDCVVDGLKIYINRVSLGGTAGGTPAAILFDWEAAPHELEIGAGFAGVIEEETTIPPGSYYNLAVGLDGRFAVKAWAFLDTDGDGVEDTTLWTTASGIELDPTKIVSTDDLTGYDYREYPYLYAGSATSPEGPNPGEAEETFFTVPLEIGDEFIYQNPDGEIVEAPAVVAVDLRVDNFRQIKMWNGEPGTASELPDTFEGFPEFYPEGEPNLLLPYLPLYGLFDAADAEAQTYQFSAMVDFPYGYAQIFSVIVTGAGKPLFGRNGGPTQSFQLNQFFNEFVETDPGVYTFNVREAPYLPYAPDTVEHIVSGFSPMDVGDPPQEITISGGAACPSGCGMTTAYVRRIARP